MFKKITAILAVLVGLFALPGYGQTAIDTAASRQSLQFLQGDGVYENGMMTFLGRPEGLHLVALWPFYRRRPGAGGHIMIIFFAIKSYEMISGDKPLEIMPLLQALRPGDDHSLVGRLC